jgi:hypothetical protein
MNVIVDEPIDITPFSEEDRETVLEKVRSIIFQNLQRHGAAS